MQKSASGVGGRPDEDEPVGADAEVAVAEPLDGLGRESSSLGEVLDHDEVVAESVHLGELEFHGVSSPVSRSPARIQRVRVAD